MNNRILAYVLTLLASPLMLEGFPASTDAGKSVFDQMATIGIRGTNFWESEIDGGLGVLLMHGIVDVSNAAGTVTLTKRSR